MPSSDESATSVTDRLIQESVKSIDACRRRSKQTILERRYGSLSNETKRDIFQLEVSMCLEDAYMKCIQRVNQTHSLLPSTEICEPLVKEYVRMDRTLTS